MSGKNIVPEEFGYSFLFGQPHSIYKQCIKDFQELITSDQFSELVQSFNQNVESYQLIETTSLGSLNQYVWLDNRKEKAICVVFDSMNTIHRLLIKPYNTFPERDIHYTKNTYTMPIKEEWFVFWGGTNEFLNYHYVYESQRYAYDLVIMKDGQTNKNKTMLNENYYAFNKNVIAPADGQVIKVVNHIIDNVPGEMNESQPAGNYIVVAHPNKEFSMLAHFKQHSIMVNEGDAVKQGQIIGYCGNSGNSSEPHIHFQVMNSPDIMECRSIRIRFNNGEEPIQGDMITRSMSRKSQKMDTFDKLESTFTMADIFLFIPRIIGSFFK